MEALPRILAHPVQPEDLDARRVLLAHRDGNAMGYIVGAEIYDHLEKVVDRFDDILVVQLASATMERQKDAVIEALVQVLKPGGILFKNDSAARDAEGLERYVDTVFGVVPDWVPLIENGVQFEAPVREGQKTGWFYDHRMNRARLAPYVEGKRVLDLFSYIGGWGVQAAAFGASEVFCVDASAFALDGVERNAALNGVAEKLTCVEGDVFAALCGMPGIGLVAVEAVDDVAGRFQLVQPADGGGEIELDAGQQLAKLIVQLMGEPAGGFFLGLQHMPGDAVKLI